VCRNLLAMLRRIERSVSAFLFGVYRPNAVSLGDSMRWLGRFISVMSRGASAGFLISIAFLVVAYVVEHVHPFLDELYADVQRPMIMPLTFGVCWLVGMGAVATSLDKKLQDARDGES
jgi:hypothetical protein